MNIIFDTSFLVQLDRKNAAAIELGKILFDKHYHLWISVISVTEMMTGAKLSHEPEISSKNVLSILNLFNWISVNDKIAFRTSDISAYLILNNRRIEFQDMLISATALEIGVEYLVTENKKDFALIPALTDKVFTISELSAKL